MLTMKVSLEQRGMNDVRVMVDGRDQAQATSLEITMAGFIQNLIREGVTVIADKAHFGGGKTMEQAEQALEIDKALDPENLFGTGEAE